MKVFAEILRLQEVIDRQHFVELLRRHESAFEDNLAYRLPGARTLLAYLVTFVVPDDVIKVGNYADRVVYVTAANLFVCGNPVNALGT